MAQYIKQGNIFGRIGTGIGKGFTEQLPEELTRGRLAQGLKEFEQDAANLTPLQQGARLLAIPGMTPQGIQTMGDLARQQAMMQGAKGINSEERKQFEEIKNSLKASPEGIAKGLIGTTNTQAALQPAIPKSLEDLQRRAVQLNEQSPGLYPDYRSALAGAELEDKQRIAQNTAQQAGRQSQKGVETDIRKEIDNLKQKANVQIPDNVYQKVENKALDDIRRGAKDELTAAKDARDELERVSRDYSAIDSLGGFTLMAGDAKDVRSSLNSLRKKFKENNDLENFADAMVARNGLSNEYAHYIANPPPRKISDSIKSLPALKGKISASGGLMGYTGPKKSDIAQQTEKIVPKLAQMMDKNDSPLAIGYELSKKGYDANMWRNYLIEHQKELNLSLSQVRELEKTDKVGQGFLNDWWLQTFGGP